MCAEAAEEPSGRYLDYVPWVLQPDALGSNTKRTFTLLMCHIRFGLTGIHFDDLETSRPSLMETVSRPLISEAPTPEASPRRRRKVEKAAPNQPIYTDMRSSQLKLGQAVTASPKSSTPYRKDNGLVEDKKSKEPKVAAEHSEAVSTENHNEPTDPSTNGNANRKQHTGKRVSFAGTTDHGPVAKHVRFADMVTEIPPNNDVASESGTESSSESFTDPPSQNLAAAFRHAQRGTTLEAPDSDVEALIDGHNLSPDENAVSVEMKSRRPNIATKSEKTEIPSEFSKAVNKSRSYGDVKSTSGKKTASNEDRFLRQRDSSPLRSLHKRYEKPQANARRKADVPKPTLLVQRSIAANRRRVFTSQRGPA